MNFHLEFPIPAHKNKIQYVDKLLFLGSCFAENIGEIMNKSKMNVCINPNGILYNPQSIGAALKRYIDNKKLEETDLFYANETWNSWEHHSRFSDADRKKSLDKINQEIEFAHQWIRECEWLFITFGSAFSYSHNELKIPVANCHKLPHKDFTKSLLTVDSIKKEFGALITQLQNLNPSVNIVFTISPVRYIRDGVVENNLSKSILIQSVHEIIKSYSNTIYFPAYELIIDDLRDYRFYKTDLVHPNESAIDYVFEKLRGSYFSDEGKIIFEKVREIIIDAEHRPFNKSAEAYMKFKENYQKKCLSLQKQFPFLNLANKELN